MSAIFDVPADGRYPVRLVNVQTLGAMCGRFESQEAAEQELRRRGYTDDQFWRDGGRVVCFLGGVNC